MLSGFGTLLDKLQGLLSKGFLLGGYIPFILFCLLNLSMMHWLFPTYFQTVYNLIDPPEKDSLYFWLRIVLLSFSGGVVFWLANPFFRQFLEGAFFPPSLQRWMKSRQDEHLDYLNKQKDELLKELYDFRRIGPDMEENLKQARIEGTGKLNADPKAELLQTFDDYKKKTERWETIASAQLEKFSNDLITDLKSKSANKNDLLDILQTSFFDLFTKQWERQETGLAKITNEIEQLFPSDNSTIGVTQLGNYAQVHREYGLSRYGLEIEFFWNRILKFIRNDADFSPILEEAKTQLDFSVAITLVILLFVAIWFIPCVFCTVSLAPFLVVFGAGAPCFAIFYRITAQNYRGFADTVRSAVDLYRFKLLESLHIQMPADSEEEKKLWRSLLDNGKQRPTIVYNFPKKTVVPPDVQAKETIWQKFLKYIGVK